MQVTFEMFVHGTHKLTPEIKVAANLRRVRDQAKDKLLIQIFRQKLAK